MPRGRKSARPLGSSQWYIREWMGHYGKIQADLEKELGWSKDTASLVFNLHRGYREELLAQVATWLTVRPYELLMPPSEAFSIRRLRDTAAEIVKDMPKGEANETIPDRSRSTA